MSLALPEQLEAAGTEIGLLGIPLNGRIRAEFPWLLISCQDAAPVPLPNREPAAAGGPQEH